MEEPRRPDLGRGPGLVDLFSFLIFFTTRTLICNIYEALLIQTFAFAHFRSCYRTITCWTSFQSCKFYRSYAVLFNRPMFKNFEWAGNKFA